MTMPLLGMSAMASAHVTKAAKHHHKTGGGGSSTGGAPAPITVQIDPNPLVETGQSYVIAVIQVETSPSFAGDPITISSSQLAASCFGGVEYSNWQVEPPVPTIQVFLDDDGNATVGVVGTDCAPGTSVIEADLDVAPYYTALGTLVANPPVVTTPGVSGYPTYSGIVPGGETETGDTTDSGFSDVYAAFYVETSPVYAELPAEISSSELEGRCGDGWQWDSDTTTLPGHGVNHESPIQGTLDDDGNTVFIFSGASCAAGSSEVVADVIGGTHPTYTTTFNINPPAPTI
jgi:hypothetical protein